jgi:hypothetical protein
MRHADCAVERTAGSHSLAAAAHCQRSPHRRWKRAQRGRTLAGEPAEITAIGWVEDRDAGQAEPPATRRYGRAAGHQGRGCDHESPSTQRWVDWSITADTRACGQANRLRGGPRSRDRRGRTLRGACVPGAGASWDRRGVEQRGPADRGARVARPPAAHHDRYTHKGRTS